MGFLISCRRGRPNSRRALLFLSQNACSGEKGTSSACLGCSSCSGLRSEHRNQTFSDLGARVLSCPPMGCPAEMAAAVFVCEHLFTGLPWLRDLGPVTANLSPQVHQLHMEDEMTMLGFKTWTADYEPQRPCKVLPSQGPRLRHATCHPATRALFSVVIGVSTPLPSI